MNKQLVILCVFVFVGASGCGKTKGNVSGKVTVDDKAVAFGIVILVGLDNQPITAEIQPDGAYSAKDVIYGPLRFAVNSPKPRTDRGDASKRDLLPSLKSAFKDPPKDSQPPTLNVDPANWIEIPSKYTNHDTSEVTFTLQEKNATFNISMKNTKE